MQFLDNRVRFLYSNFLVYMGEIHTSCYNSCYNSEIKKKNYFSENAVFRLVDHTETFKTTHQDSENAVFRPVDHITDINTVSAN